MRKTILAAAALLTITVLAGGAYASKDFTDVSGHWANSSINAAVSRGYVDGYPDGTFKPEQSVTRAEFIKMAIDAMGYKKAAGAASPWYSPYVDAAITNGLSIKGEISNYDQPISRLEMSRIAVRSTGEQNTDALKWMYLATSKGIINGMDNQGTLGEDQPTTRAQAITVIERMLKLKAGEKLPWDRYATSAAEIAWHKANVYTMAPEYFGYGKDRNRPFRTDLLRYDGPNGYSEVEKYVIVDLDDPNDPNRKLIPEGMMWERVGPSTPRGVFDKTTELPTKAYLFLSFNHFVVDLDKTANPFRFAYLTVLPFNSSGVNLNENGDLSNITGYMIYEPKYKSFLAGVMPWLEPGHYDTRIITGTLVPKGKGGIDGDGFGVKREPAQELGEDRVTVIYSSQIDYSLSGR
ncbi:S-layer homology domain-containing protein [Paenibacillus piri]|uniref:S-layer homology domain-containing protein n=1 Tax=Paenibacillus piri TaxID=2547395 RepID=A0A4R5KPG3_9BACL|nr:S-layer homology domain-containing protein [Paenibacillus piri]TDF97571.1 S-layer homology domain-containing protein [Paenibacillus piri]